MQNSATGGNAVALGAGSLSAGLASLAVGWFPVATGNSSAAFNQYTSAGAFASSAFGQYNVGGGNATSWVATDPLFEIGNGTSSSATSDALVVYKNGDAAVQGNFSTGGVITTSPGGDIPMYSGN